MKPNTKYTWAKLADDLGFSRRSITSWRKLPGCPESPDLRAWRRFIAERGLGLPGSRVSGERETLLRGKLERETRLLDLKIAKEEGTYVLRSDVNEMLLHMGTSLRALLYQRLGRELGARGEGKSAAELNALGQAIGDELCNILRTNHENWLIEK